MSKTIYDIFISYRRDGGGATAGRINDMLMADGYSVSYDVDTLREGRFDEQLLKRIEQCQDFILVVDKNCFARTIDPATDPKDDWLWQELSYALRLKKNVIPVLLAGASFPKWLPEDIDNVRLSNGPKCVHEYFDSFYSKLKDFLHAYPRLVNPQSAEAFTQTNMMPCLKLKADMDCVFYLDGEEHSHLKAGIIQKIPLAKGEYELMFVSEDNDTDRVELEFEMPEVDKLVKVNLLEVMNNRVQKEEETKRLVEEKRKAEEAQRLAEERRRETERKAAEEKRKQREEERKRREELERAKVRTFNVDGVSFNMIRVEGGSFQMGSPDYDSNAYDNEKPQHWVTLSDYYIGETQVTQALWKAVMGTNPARFVGGNRPVECVLWDDCQEFVKKLNSRLGKELSGLRFCLPIEAQWEYAARGGKNSRGYKYSGSDYIDDVAWYDGNSGDETLPVKGKKANELGLYDMSGNVWEWCQDWYGSYITGSPNNPQGPPSGSAHVLRGGGWHSSAGFCRVAFRGRSSGHRINFIGFRLALVHK